MTKQNNASPTTQEFIDELNSTLPSGCTPWKLGLDGYPTLDF